MARGSGLVVRAEDSRSRDCRFESCHTLQGCSHASYYILIDKKKNKGSQMEHTVKNIKKLYFSKYKI
jgi:hypothetical protein